MSDQPTAKTIVVTGATAGIGLAAAEALARQGVSVIGVGRSAERCRAAERQIRAANPDARLAFLLADLSVQSQVRALSADIRQLLAAWGQDHLDGLLNNAGVFFYWMALTPEGFETTWAVNHLAPFLLTHELLPLIRAAPAGRVVTVSSASHYGARLKWDDVQLRRGYNGLRAYAQSKLANVLFTLELRRRIEDDSRLRAFAADPGLVRTDIGLKATPALAGWVWKWRSSSGISPAESAKGIVYLLTEPSIHDSGEIYWKHSAPKAPSPHALDREAAGRLWALSAQMCGLPAEPAAEATT